MKKTITGLMVGIMLLAPSISFAQVVDISPQSKAEIIADLQAKIQELLIQLIQQLQLELSQALAQNTTAINSVSAKVDTVISNQPTQTFGGVSTPAPSSLSVSLGNLTCSDSKFVQIPFTVTGGNWSKVSVSYNKIQQGVQSGGVIQLQPQLPTVPAEISVNSPRSYFEVWNYPWIYSFVVTPYDLQGNPSSPLTTTFEVTSTCRDSVSDIVLPL